ncbi:MAG: DUF4129 domain-containing protein [Candidatus Riflebacteria bacterium]|nr:DUF4129 domain-containing protein [Candidatus Riflebacteria bacterium]
MALVVFIVRSFKKTITLQEGQVLLGNLHVSDEKREAKSLYDRAVALANAGNVEEAIRLLTTGCLLLLEERAVLAYQDHYTNGEYLSLLVQRKKLHDLFRAPLSLFDRTVYGFSRPTRQDFEVFRVLYERLLSGGGTG